MGKWINKKKISDRFKKLQSESRDSLTGGVTERKEGRRAAVHTRLHTKSSPPPPLYALFLFNWNLLLPLGEYIFHCHFLWANFILFFFFFFKSLPFLSRWTPCFLVFCMPWFQILDTECCCSGDIHREISLRAFGRSEYIYIFPLHSSLSCLFPSRSSSGSVIRSFWLFYTIFLFAVAYFDVLSVLGSFLWSCSVSLVLGEWTSSK